MVVLELTERELEIERLREKEGLSFREIGLRFQISANRASFLYRQARRKHNEQRRWELYQEQNMRPVTLNLTLGEIVQLRRILTDYGRLREFRIHAKSIERELLQADIDYINAGRLHDKLMEIEKTQRSIE